MGRHNGDYLLGTLSLAIALIAALSHGKSESAPRQCTDGSPAVPSGHQTTVSDILQHPSANASPTPAYAVLNNLSRGTRIVVGSLDLSGARHAILVGNATDDAVPGESLSVIRYSLNDSSCAWPGAYMHNCRSVPGVEPAQTENVGPVHVHALSESQPRVFLIPHFGDSGSVHEPAECRLIGESCRVRVYLDQHLVQAGNPRKYTAWSERLASAAELQALPIVEAWIGSISDVDVDQKLSIVVTDLDQRTQDVSGRTPIHGCIREADFLSNTDFCGDIVYVDLSILELPADELAALLTHEATHAAVCSLQTRESAGTSAFTADVGCLPARHQIPSWLNEAVAHYLELQVSGNRPLQPCLQQESASFNIGMALDSHADWSNSELPVPVGRISQNFQRRIVDFLANPARSPIVAADDILTLEERRSGSRGAATLFLAPCFSSPEILQQFLRSQGDLDRRIEDLTNAPFAEVFRRWTLSMATISCDDPTLSMNLLPAATRQEHYSLLGTAFLCFECSEDVASLVIKSNDDASLQISIIEPSPALAFLAGPPYRTSRSAVRISGPVVAIP